MKRKPNTPKTKASSSKVKDNEKEGENSTFEPSDDNENNFETKNLGASSEESKNLEECKDDWNTSEIHIKSFRILSILHQTHEERSPIYVGQYLPTSVRGDQRVSHSPSRSESSSIRKTFPAICSSDGSFLRSFATPKQ